MTGPQPPDYTRDDERMDWNEPDSMGSGKIWLIALIAGVLVCAIAVLLTFEAEAHDAPMGWRYDVACCSSFDCRPVERDAIIESPDGYVIRATGEVIPYSSRKVRHSQDSDFHWCSVGGKPDSRTLCLYVPHGGS
jgi:hypothetical protein